MRILKPARQTSDLSKNCTFLRHPVPKKFPPTCSNFRTSWSTANHCACTYFHIKRIKWIWRKVILQLSVWNYNIGSFDLEWPEQLPTTSNFEYRNLVLIWESIPIDLSRWVPCYVEEKWWIVPSCINAMRCSIWLYGGKRKYYICICIWEKYFICLANTLVRDSENAYWLLMLETYHVGQRTWGVYQFSLMHFSF